MKFYTSFLVLTFTSMNGLTYSYVNITDDAGIDMTHTATLMSTGIAVADFDNNGFVDLFFTGFENDAALYFNQGNGQFIEQVSFTMPDFTGADCGSVAAADYDNDGWQDLYVACRGNNYFLRNNEGNGFLDLTSSSGTNHPERSEAVAWGDLNNDGLLDLVVGVHPLSFPINPNDPNDLDQIFFNNGDSTFTNIHTSIIPAHIGKATLALILSDLDFDGDLDIYMANDKYQFNVFLENLGPGCQGWCFEDVATLNGSQVPAFSMGIAVADYDNDGDWDMSYSSIAEHIFLHNNGTAAAPIFNEAAVAVGIDFDNGSGWGTLMFDADNDGWEDLFFATGQGLPAATNLYFQNNQNGTFTEMTSSMSLIDTNRTHAAVWLDHNKDGNLDLAYGRFNQKYQLLENSGGSENWLAIDFEGGLHINRDAIGTKVFAETDTGLQMIRELRSGESRGSNNQKLIHFGLGTASHVDLRIVWPDGAIQVETDVPTNQYIAYDYPSYDALFSSDFD